MKNLVKKYFIPNEENEYVPHIMRKASIAVLSFISIFVFFVGVLHVVVIQNTSLLSAVIPDSLVVLANNNRVQNKLNSLAQNTVLQMAAQKKANDMAAKGYFAHTSPDGKSPWFWFKEVGYDFQYAGENLAVNFVDSQDVDTAWMNSPGHRANILNGKFTEIGIATAKGYYNGRETIFVVQMFGKPLRTGSTRFVQKAVQPQIVSASGSSTPTSTPKLQTIQSNQKSVSTSTPTSTPKVTTQRVLGETESFIETEVPIDSEDAIAVNDLMNSGGDTKIPLSESLLTKPKKVVTTIYLFIGGLILLVLILMVGIEIKRQHPKHIALGVALIFLICLLAFLYRTLLFPEVLVI